MNTEKEPSQGAMEEAFNVVKDIDTTWALELPATTIGILAGGLATALAAKEEERQKDQAECLRLAERVGVAEQERDQLKQQLEQAVRLLRTCQGALGWRSISQLLSRHTASQDIKQ